MESRTAACAGASEHQGSHRASCPHLQFVFCSYTIAQNVFGEVTEQEEHDPPVQDATPAEVLSTPAPAPPPIEHLCPRCRNPKFTRPHTRKEGCKLAGTVYDGNPKGPGKPAAAEAKIEQVESISLPLRHGCVSQSMIAQASTTKGVKSRVNQGGSSSVPSGTLKGVSASARDLHPKSQHSSSKPILPFEGRIR